MNCAEMTFRDGLKTHFDDRILTIGRTAVLTQVHKGRAAYAHYCGVCRSQLHHRLLLQQQQFHAARRAENRQAHHPPL